MTDERMIIATTEAPAAIGPYSQAVLRGGFLFCSGQIPLDPDSGEISGANAAEQARRCLENLEAVCAAAGTELARAVKVTMYLRDIADFAAVNEVYAGFFSVDPPARAAVAVVGLPRDVLVEIDAVVAGD
jgi:2-iminobutanoate/2-iminopropanoate deaminase